MASIYAMSTRELLPAKIILNKGKNIDFCYILKITDQEIRYKIEDQVQIINKNNFYKIIVLTDKKVK